MMSMRALVLLMGLILIGNADALAVNAPLTVDRNADSREDLFASKPRTAAPAASPAAAPAAEQARAERLPGGNPLWAIPLARLTATREHPLFAPSRQPQPVAVVAAPAAAAMAPPPKPVEPEKPQLSLLGTIAGTRSAAGVGLFMDSASKVVLSLKAGENHKGWTLQAVRRHQVELARGLDSAVLELPPPDMKAGPAGPVLAVPAVMPATAPPVPAALPVNATRTSLPIGPIVPPGVPPPTFKPAPPEVNPFGDKWRQR
jgi:hypothetical protein